jgi:hypothetical protein
MVSSLAPSISSVGTPKLLGTTALPRLASRSPDFSSLLGDSHVDGSPGNGSSSSSPASGRSYATPRTLSRLGRIPEMSTESGATSLVHSIPGAHPKSSRFPAPNHQQRRHHISLRRTKRIYKMLLPTRISRLRRGTRRKYLLCWIGDFGTPQFDARSCYCRTSSLRNRCHPATSPYVHKWQQRRRHSVRPSRRC